MSEKMRIARVTTAIILLIFWGLLSNELTLNPSQTSTVILFAVGMFGVITIVIELVWRKDIEKRMNELLNYEIREKRDSLVNSLEDLISYLKETKYPTFSDADIEELTEDLQKINSIKSKYMVAPKILKSTVLIIISSMFLLIYLINPNLVVLTSKSGEPLTIAHLGMALLVIGLWFIFDILYTVLEIKIWER